MHCLCYFRTVVNPASSLRSALQRRISGGKASGSFALPLATRARNENRLLASDYATLSAETAPDAGKNEKKVVFSGIQPTGSLHLGNYLGAVKQWKDLQEHQDKSLIISVVDMHAITLPWNSETLRKNILQMFIQLLASGIDPNKTTLFLQSKVPEHCQLQWIFSCLTTLARIDNLPQFKEKSAPLQPKKVIEGQPPPQIDAACGLLMYPILQAADILLYKAQLVPVGEDQVHHLQLAQHISRVFNNKFGKFFPYCQRLHSDQPRLKSLRDPAKKMSKSDTDARSRIDFTDSPDQMREKLKKSVTDSVSAIVHDPENRPGVANLVSLYASITSRTVDEVMVEVSQTDKVTFKSRIAEALIEMLRPVQKEMQALQNDLDYVDSVVEMGTIKARQIAQKNLDDVFHLVGFDLKTGKSAVEKIAVSQK